MIFKGTTSGSIYSAQMEDAAKITSYSLVNNTGGALSVQVAIVEEGVATTYINSQSVPANGQYSTDVGMIVKRGWYIHIISAGEIFFYFNLDKP